jgi:hypothetical protein
MNKIIGICLLMVFSLSFMALAGSDLVIEDFKLKADKVLPKESYGYTLEVKNVGDEPSKTRLPVLISPVGVEEPNAHPVFLIQSYVDTRKNTAINPIKVIAKDGTETTQTPVYEENYVYLTDADTPAEIEQRKQSYLARAEGKSSDEINQALAEIEITYGQRYEVAVDGYFITLNPGETAVFDTDDTFNKADKIFVPVGEPSLVPFETNYKLALDSDMEGDSNPYNNEFTAKIMVEPNVLQGPQPATPKNKELKDATEYFSYGSVGCVMLQDKKVCVNVENVEETIIVSVNGQEEKYNFYGLFMNWLNKIFSDGKLAPTRDVRGVEVTIYPEGVKLKLTGV